MKGDSHYTHSTVSLSYLSACGIAINVGNRMFLEMQNIDFAQIIESNLPKSDHLCPNFASILLKFIQIHSNLSKSN